jgi:PAS domain S-box-containing protein
LERTLLALQRSEARYKTLLQQHPDPIARCRADGTITAANTAFAHYFGQFEQPVIGDSLWALVQPDHDLQAQLECGFEQLRHADPDQRIVQFEHRPTPTDRQQWWHWILSGIYERDAQLLEVQLIGHRGSDRQEVDPLAQTPDLDADLATDIRQLTQANQQLQLELQHQQATWQQSEARHRAIVTSLQEGVMVINAAGQVQTCNASAAKMLGLNVPELLRHCLFDRQWQWLQTNAMPLPLHDHPAQLTLQTGIPCIAVNLGLQRPDQTRLWLSVNTQPRFHARELLPYEVIVSLTDRTQQQQAEHDRQALLRREQAAQAQVTQTKAQIEEILESVTDSFIACDRDWHFTYVNREAARTIGRSRKSLLGKVLWQEFPEFAHSSIAQFLKQSQRQHTVSEIVEYYAPCDRWYSLRVHPSPKEIAIYFRDMTDTFHHIDERNQVAADLQESQERLRQLTENIPQVFWLYDLQEQRIIYISRACQTVLGVAPERASQKNWHDWLARVHADDRAAVSKASKRPFTGRSGEVTYRFMRPDSTVRWLHGRAFPVRNAAGKVYRVAGMVEDVSDRQQKENWLTLLESVIINANDAVVITAANPIELPGPRIIFVNSAFSKMMGYSREEVLGKTPRLLQGPKTDPAKLASVRSALKHRQPLRVELINYRKDGSEVWIELSIFPVTDTLGHCNYWVGIQRDITQRKQAEADLEKTLRQERELSELKSRFISTTSHEFRTPLSTILSSVDLLEYYAERLIASEERSRYVEHTRRIQNAALNMNHLLNDLLIIEQAEANGWQLEPIELNLREFFQHLIDEMRFNDQNHHPITFQVRRSDGILEQNVAVMVHMDERLLRQIFSNLLSNALKYSPIDTPINVRMHCSKDQIIVQIRDRGIGIPAIDQTRLFEPFHRATNVGTVAGTGLGLAITKQAVDRHSGSIIIRSKVQQGTIVTVRLPRHPPHHQPATAPPLNMDAQTLDRPHINSHSLDPPNRQTPLNHQPHGE